MVKVLLSVDFLTELNKYASKKLEDFDDANSMELEDYLFFKELIYNRSIIYLNLSKKQITYYTDPNLQIDDLEPGIKNLAIAFKRLKINIIESGVDLYNELLNKDYNNLNPDNIPEFLILSDASKDNCKDIEKETGIFCFSIKNNKVPDDVKRVELIKLSNTKDALFSKLNNHSVYSIIIEDPAFINRHRTEEDINNLFENLFETRLPTFKLKKFQFQLRYKNEMGNWLEIFRNVLLNFNNINNNVLETIEHNSARHDRYIFTNKHIIILGNSLNQNGRTHFTSFPRWLYYDFLN